MIYRILWLIVLAGTMCRCGGSAFTSTDPPPDPTPDAPAPALDGGAEIAVIVAGPEAAAVPPDAATDAAPTPDAAQVPESRAPAPDVCVPTSGFATPSPCPSTCLGGCAGQYWPGYFFLGCGGTTTPPECMACGSYTCACIVAARSWCVGGGTPTCSNDTGLVTVVCQ